jgi:hypothetical protein
VAITAVVLLVVGFFLIVPRDSAPGSVGNRQVRQGALGVVTTPGRSPSTRRAYVVRLTVGLLMIAVGIVLFLVD